MSPTKFNNNVLTILSIIHVVFLDGHKYRYILVTQWDGSYQKTGPVPANTVTVEQLQVLNATNVSASLGNQHATRMRHIVICGLPRSTIFTLSHKWHDIRKELLNIKCVFLCFVDRAS